MTRLEKETLLNLYKFVVATYDWAEEHWDYAGANAFPTLSDEAFATLVAADVFRRATKSSSTGGNIEAR